MTGEAKKSTTRNGHPISRYVPNSLLPAGKVVDIIEAHYRVVGPGAQIKAANADPEGFTSPFQRLFARAHYVTRVSYREAISAPIRNSFSGTDLMACSDGAAGADAFEDFQGLDVIIQVGVTRETFQVETGGVEWAYALLLSSLLQHNGFDVKPILQYCDPVADGVHTMKYIPNTALYVEQTVLRLTSEDDRPLLPFTVNKQNLVLKVIDTLGLHQKSGTARINITNVSQECQFVGGMGHISVVDVTFLTQRSEAHELFSMVLMDVLPGLMDGLVEEGLAVAHAEVVASEPAEELSLIGKVAALLDPDDPIRIFDERLPLNQLPTFSLSRRGTVGWLSRYKGILAAIASTVALAGASWYIFLRPGDYPDSFSDSRASSLSSASALRPLPSTLVPQALLAKMASHPTINLHSSFNLRSWTSLAAGPGTPHAPASAEGSPADFTRIPSGDDFNAFENMLEAPYQQGQAPGQEFVGAVKSGPSGSEWPSTCLLFDARSESSTSSSRIAADFGGARYNGEQPWVLDPLRNQKLERLEEIKGWQIQDGEVEICKRPDGSDYLLGEGGYGKVYKGIRDRVQEVAVKVLHTSDFVQLQDFEYEIRLLQSLSYDRNVVQFLGACFNRGRPMLVLEWMEGGDLYEAVHSKQERFRWPNQGQHLALDIVRGLHFLHKNKVLHGDLKTRNVLLGRNAAYAKLSDVGLSRMLSSTMKSASLSPEPLGGTFAYAAPEMLLGLRCTTKADIFSLGKLLYEIITQESPCRGQMRDIRVSEECPAAVAELVDKCLDHDPQNRPSCQEVYEVISSNLV